MRIITGRARGMKLLPPKDYAVRPTSDRVKEALFNIIKDRIAGAVVLDAFGGTGNLALEAWSRGARKVVLFDKNRESLRLIRFNVEKAKAGADAKGNGEIYDLVFSDPPYDKGLNEALYKALCQHGILRDGGLLVLEHSLLEDPREYVKAGTEIRIEKYGDTKISLIEWKSL